MPQKQEQRKPSPGKCKYCDRDVIWVPVTKKDGTKAAYPCQDENVIAIVTANGHIVKGFMAHPQHCPNQPVREKGEILDKLRNLPK